MKATTSGVSYSLRERFSGQPHVLAEDISAAVSIFDGTGHIIHGALGLRPGQGVTSVSAALMKLATSRGQSIETGKLALPLPDRTR